MAPQPETRLVNRIRAALQDRHPGVWIMKVHGGPTQTAGIPDLLVCLQGQLIGLEVKCPRPGETEEAACRRATVIQQAQLAKLRAAGAGASVVASVGAALQAVDLHMTYSCTTVASSATEQEGNPHERQS